MTQPKILIMSPYTESEMAELEAEYQVYKIYEASDRFAFLERHGKGIRALATRGDVGVSAEVMAALPDLEIVSSYGVGTDAIDLDYAKSRGIRVTYTPDVLTADVADMAVGLLLATARRLPQGDKYVRDGSWTKANMDLTTRVHGKKVGIVGMGRIGAAVAKRLSAFDCEIYYFDVNLRSDLPYTYAPELTQLAGICEFLIVTLAGGELTRGIVNRNVLRALGQEGIVINVSRGSTIDEDALIDALGNRTIKGAGLDVFLNEPDIDRRFFKFDNVVLQPHQASATLETRRAMSRLMQHNLAEYFAGRPLLTPVL